MKTVILSLYLIIYLTPSITCAKILGVFPFAAKSHFTLGNALMKGLANAGHDVTMISSHKNKEPPLRGTYRDVLLTGFAENFKDVLIELDLINMEDANSIKHPYIVQTGMFRIIEETFSHPNVQKLLRSDEKFDAVIVEKFYNDAFLVFAHHYKAPLILFSAIGPSPCVNGMIANPEPHSYIPHFVTTYFPQMDFFHRMLNSYLYSFQYIADHVYFLPKHDKLMKKYFPDAPSIYDLYYNASLVMVNSHESFGQSVPLVPNIIQIGGFHVTPPKKLPEDLQTFLDDAKEGVIYFCLGSNLKSNELPDFKRKALLKAFGKLKEKVLMKWEEDHLIDQPSNVFVKKWIPQSDILAHPNIKLFITHGGLLSTTEAVYHGVPLLVIPVFADQHNNAVNVVLSGYGLKLPYLDPEFNEEKLSYLINQLLHNPKYKENAKRRSQLFHDRPMTPIEAANYWVKFVIRHNGATHLRVAGVGLPWYKYFLLDIIAFITVVVVGTFYLLYKCVTICRKPKQKSKLKKK